MPRKFPIRPTARSGRTIYTRRKVVRDESRDKSGAYVRGRRWNVTFPVRPPGNDVSNEHEGTLRRDAPAPNSVRRGSIDPVDGEQIDEKTEKKRERGKKREPGDLGGWLRRACTHARMPAGR